MNALRNMLAAVGLVDPPPHPHRRIRWAKPTPHWTLHAIEQRRALSHKHSPAYWRCKVARIANGIREQAPLVWWQFELIDTHKRAGKL